MSFCFLIVWWKISLLKEIFSEKITTQSLSTPSWWSCLFSKSIDIITRLVMKFLMSGGLARKKKIYNHLGDKEIYDPTRRGHTGHESSKILNTDPTRKVESGQLTRVNSNLSEHYFRLYITAITSPFRLYFMLFCHYFLSFVTSFLVR